MATAQLQSGDGKQDKETLYGLNWSNPRFSPQLINALNVLDYFSDRTNPFYDRECNNEVIRMQRLNPDHLVNMYGVEYCLHSAQEPVLYVIAKQHRQSPTQVSPLAMYYIINGVVHQAPDMVALMNSRLLTALYHLNGSFQEISSYARYHPANGTYSWDFTGSSSQKKSTHERTASGGSREETPDSSTTGSAFQRQRVDMVLGEWTRRFPPPDIPQVTQASSPVNTAPTSSQADSERTTEEERSRPSSTVNGQSAGPTPEKKPRLT